MKKTVKYLPEGLANFHDASALTLRVEDNPVEYRDEPGGPTYYEISPHQARRIERHFCGIRGCCCGRGGVRELEWDEYDRPVRFLIWTRYCSHK